MKLIIVPSFRQKDDPPGVGSYFVREVLGEMEKQGALDGIEIDIDIGPEGADEMPLVTRPIGILERVQQYCDGSTYDAIVITQGGDLGVLAARMVSKIPVISMVPSAIHVASLIGDRFTILYSDDKSAFSVRRLVNEYGLGNKLAAARSFDVPHHLMWETVRTVKKGERGKTAQGDKIIDNITAQCIKGIEEDRADSIILIGPHHSCFADEVRQRLDEKGYDEIPIVLGVHAAIEMAKTLVHMGLMQAPRAHPTGDLKAKPAYR